MTVFAGTVGTAERDALLLLYQHRLATSAQLRRLITPHTTNRQYIWEILNRLRHKRLVERVAGPAHRAHLWYLTPLGADAVEEEEVVPVRRHRMSRTRASGPLQHHALAVTEVGVLFFEDALRRGDSFGPLSWVPEVAHRYTKGTGDEDFKRTHVVCDALLHYTRVHPSGARTQLQSFLELDRSTMPVHRLATKLVAYARYFDHVPLPEVPGGRRKVTTQRGGTPAWAKRYPRFPRILVVIDGPRPELQASRRSDLAAYVDNIPYLVEPRPGFALGCCTMDDLAKHGPNAPIWSNLLSSDPDTLTDFRLRARND